MASGANGFGANFTLATVEINGRDGAAFTGECLSTDQARVRTIVVPSGGAYSPSVLANEAFYVWFNCRLVHETDGRSVSIVVA